jgi:glycosyltransferase involved in cell wall biosynthesis
MTLRSGFLAQKHQGCESGSDNKPYACQQSHWSFEPACFALKILLLNQVFYPDVVATAQYLNELATTLTERGHQVTVVSSRRAYEHPETRYAAREEWRKIDIIRVFSTHLGKGAKWRRAVDFASFLIFCCARLVILPRHDVVVTLTTPPLISFIGAWRANLWRARFVYWVMDFNPDEAIAAGWLRAGSLAARFLERLSRFSLRRADNIVALDRFMRDRIVAKDIPPQKVAVIPPWSLDNEVNYDENGRLKFRILHRLDGKFVVMYSGNHSPVHPMDTVMKAADRLREHKDIVFAFIGGGSEFARIKRWSVDNPQVLCLPYQPLQQLSASLSAAEAQLVVMGNAMLGLVHPCKIYNIFAVGSPVVYIGPEASHVTEALGTIGGDIQFISVRHGDADKLASELLRLKGRLPKHRDQSANNTAIFSAKRILPQLVAVVENTQVLRPEEGAPRQ